MASVELQTTMDEVSAPHLRLDPADNTYKHVQTKSNRGKDFLQGTLEADNKKRPAIQKQNSLRYKSLPPEPADPNSEPKSIVISKMQMRLESWNEKLIGIAEKKQRNDTIQMEEIKQRDERITDLSSKYNKECEIRKKTEKERKNLSEKLAITEKTLNDYTIQSGQLESELSQCQMAYQETETRRQELELETTELYDKVEQIEEMKRRLNDQVTELQGQVSMMQRSSACIIV